MVKKNECREPYFDKIYHCDCLNRNGTLRPCILGSTKQKRQNRNGQNPNWQLVIRLVNNWLDMGIVCGGSEIK